MLRRCSPILAVSLLVLSVTISSGQDPLEVQLQFQRETSSDGEKYVVDHRREAWQPSATAIIVCDAWDLHHCLNAVRRLKQFAPRLDEVLKNARDRGVTIIHAPSDCMEAYQDHPARRRAIEAPAANYVPHDIGLWCSSIPAEERAVYPVDQSDGGEDDDPQEHEKWRAELEAMGRNPGTPWKKQSELITIDASTDYVSDRGDEIWNVLQHKGIENVILTGVHTNMCVLGRPFGLRQMARNGKNVVLMRDMTDTMYNPKRWPYVSHFEGTRRVIAHIERFVCPTITSDQLIGGMPFRFAGDTQQETTSFRPTESDLRKHWTTVSVPDSAKHALQKDGEAVWYRCVLRVPSQWLSDHLTLTIADHGQHADAWCNGRPLEKKVRSRAAFFALPKESLQPDDANLLVIRFQAEDPLIAMTAAPKVHSGDNELALSGRWQLRIGADPAFSAMPLPAKFGGSADVVFSPPEPLWTPRPLTRRGEFTAGIEGPACDDEGNVFAVNYGDQGTIGKIRPDGSGKVFVKLPAGSIGNGIRFAPDGSFFVADYTGHNILRIDPQTGHATVHAHSKEMNQPNDLALAPDGTTLYASDPNWSEGTGQLWRIDSGGTVTRLAENMGTTNGIEVSPDGKTLYVNESKQRNVWAFTIEEDGRITNKRLLRKFDDHGFDGMRCDIDGNLYITRYGKGTVVKMSPAGEILREIPVLGGKPSNLCFGGPDGRTVYVTEVESTRLVTFRVDRPGRSFAQRQ